MGKENRLEEEMTTHPLLHFWLENPMDRGAWGATVCGVAESTERLTLLLQTTFGRETPLSSSVLVRKMIILAITSMQTWED